MDKSAEKPLFSILIPSWNNLPMLKLCVESIRRNSAYSHEILIHVNDGSDGTLEWVRKEGLKHTHSAENIGVCWALNRLRPLVESDYIVFLNDDMYVCPGWDEAYYREIRAVGNERFFLASVTIQPAPHNLRPTGVPVADFGRSVTDFREAELLRSLDGYKVPDTMGVVWPPNIVHRNMWDLVGGYSVEYTPGLGSDPDFSAKLWMAGVRHFKTLGDSICYHFMSVSVNRVTKNKGHVQFLRKWGVTPRVFMTMFLHVDEPWDASRTDPSPEIRSQLLRCKAKMLLTALQDTHAPTLLDNGFRP